MDRAEPDESTIIIIVAIVEENSQSKPPTESAEFMLALVVHRLTHTVLAVLAILMHYYSYWQWDLQCFLDY